MVAWLFLLELKQEQLRAQKIDESELVSFEELLMANSIQVDALTQSLIPKGLISKQQFYELLQDFRDKYGDNSTMDDAGAKSLIL